MRLIRGYLQQYKGKVLKNMHFYHEERGGSAKGKREAYRQLKMDGE